MNTKNIVWIVIGVVVILALGIGGGYFMGQLNKEQEINSAKQAAADEARTKAEAEATKTKDDADKTPQEKAPAKVATDTTCNADELTLTIEDAGDQSGVGTLAYNLVLTNSAQRTCTLYGFPGVSLVNDNGNQIGTPAERGTNYVEERLTLQPGTKVRSVLSIANSSNFPDGECKTGATKVRVYPPNDTGYLSVASNISSWCPGFTISPVLKM